MEQLELLDEMPRDWPSVRRLRWALWLNVIVPGAGLIALQRERPGVAVAAVFAVAAQVALAGLLLVPAMITRDAVTAAALVAAGAWLVGQVLLLGRMGQVQDAQERLMASARVEQARDAFLAGEWAEALALLRAAATYDDELADLNWLSAQVHTAVDTSDKARRQWRRLAQVDRAGRYESDIRRALSTGDGKASGSEAAGDKRRPSDRS